MLTSDTNKNNLDSSSSVIKETKGPDHQSTVDIQGLNHFYGKKQALADINLSIPRGTTVGLIGPDGVGKSTLLAVIAGVKIIQEGQVTVLGRDIKIKNERQLNSMQIAYMPQGLGQNLYPTLSVKENTNFHARLFGLNKKQREAKIQYLLEATGLAPFQDRAAGKLSGGMKQKLSLCCALVHDPDLLILDEPTTGVDPLSRRQFWELVDDLRGSVSNMTVIVATAYIDEAEHFEHILAMNDGNLLISSPTKEAIEQSHSSTLEEAYLKLLPTHNTHQQFDFNAIPPHEPSGNAAPIIEASHLCKQFGDFKAVDDVSFQIDQGEIFGFLGSNGCGKSTTMKMLTGLLNPTSGTTKLLGQKTDANNIETRLHIGYMSQNFSLYEELTVYQNLKLHAYLYRFKDDEIDKAIQVSLEEFDLTAYAEQKPSALSLGIRQRLQLAAACLHKPKILILDEPTSGVDPVARDMFWEHLIKLSREDKITIFVSTHFMNEASRCDRISLMHQGKLLAMGTPKEIIDSKKASNLEESFIAYLEEVEQASTNTATKKATPNTPAQTKNTTPTSAQGQQKSTPKSHYPKRQRWSNILTFAIRETKELVRDPVRLLFALFGPICLLLTSAWGISFDVKNINTIVFDQDQSQISHQLSDTFTKTSYFYLYKTVSSQKELDDAMKSGKVRLAIDIPPDFGKHLLQQQKPEVGFYIDGTIPFIAENIKGYILGMVGNFSITAARDNGQIVNPPNLVASRYVYNQNFNSIMTMAPSMIMVAMLLFPVVMTALGVVREREIGSITNLYTSPATVSEFLIGKQLPYILIASLSFLTLIWITIVIIGVPINGSFLAMFVGTIFTLCAATSLGLLISCFVRSQVAAIFGSSLLILIPALNFSGIFSPISSLDLANRTVSYSFPPYWYERILLGSFDKNLSWSDFYLIYIILFAFAIIYLFLASLFLKKQER